MTGEIIPWDDRDDLPNDDERIILQLYARQSGNCRSRLPAMFLLMFSEGVSREEIMRVIRRSERSMERWWSMWETGGIPQLYHMTLPEWVFSAADSTSRKGIR